MARPKRTNVKGSHKDFADKNTMNTPARGGDAQEPAGAGTQAHDVKRRIGQYGGTGQPPLQKK
jgi:hypothetical protein